MREHFVDVPREDVEGVEQPLPAARSLWRDRRFQAASASLPERVREPDVDNWDGGGSDVDCKVACFLAKV